MKKILVIEDQPQMRDNLATILEMENFQPLVAPDGRRGVELARSERPDLILCDVMMPELNGHGVLRELRATKETALIPFIFLTARSEMADLRAGMNLGADDYLIKPVARVDLLAAIATRLDRSHRLRSDFVADFKSPEPLEKLGLTPREAEVLFWLAQGKTNPEISGILAVATTTVKKHAEHIFAKLGVETRGAASLRALEWLNQET